MLDLARLSFDLEPSPVRMNGAVAMFDNVVPFPREDALEQSRLAVSTPVALGAIEGQDHTHPEGAARPVSGADRAVYHIPGRRDLHMADSEVAKYLLAELDTPLLDVLYPHLWLVARKECRNVDALHRQVIKDREIMVTEDPKLHLLWTAKRIYVKPLPCCLLNYDFWDHSLVKASFPDTDHAELSLYATASSPPRPFARSMALGFLRSYALLIRHPSDFKIARDKGLLPDGFDWDQWSCFIAHFRDLDDSEVARRYHYGQMRLARMNWAVRIYRPRKSGESNANWYYERAYWSASPYVHSAAVVLAFIFASFSLILSAMQVMLAAPASDPNAYTTAGLASYARAFFGLSIAVILASMTALVLLVSLPTLHVANQILWGFLHRDRALSSP